MHLECYGKDVKKLPGYRENEALIPQVEGEQMDRCIQWKNRFHKKRIYPAPVMTRTTKCKKCLKIDRTLMWETRDNPVFSCCWDCVHTAVIKGRLPENFLKTTDPDNMRSRNAKPKINPATVNSRPVKSKKVSSKNTIQMPLASEDGDGERHKICETGHAGPMVEVSDSVLYFWPNV